MHEISTIFGLAGSGLFGSEDENNLTRRRAVYITLYIPDMTALLSLHVTFFAFE